MISLGIGFQLAKVDGVVGNTDGLSLDLQFATDKTLTARKGPTPLLTRASPGTFVGSNGLIQSAAINAARFDHDPITRACRGLLIEESRTNLFQKSEEFNDVYWTTVRATVSADQTTSPTGATTADKLITDSSVANNHRIDRAAINLSLNTVYTLSIYVKASEYSGFAIGANASSPALGVQFSLSGSGSVTAQLAGYSGAIQDVGNGWFRCSATFTSSASIAGHRVYMYLGQNGMTFTYTGDGTSGLFLWGAQIEAGSFATSYIPTTSSALTRGADVCSIQTANFTGMYNQAEGSVLVEASTVASGTRDLVSIDTNGYYENITLLASGSSAQLSVIDNSISQVNMSTGSPISSNVAFKLACAYKLNDFAVTKNGVAPQTDNTGTLPTPNQLKIGYEKGQYILCGCVASLRYYKKRLPNAKLQSLTA